MLNGLAELLLFCKAVVLPWFVKLLFVSCIQYSFSLVNKKNKKEKHLHVDSNKLYYFLLRIFC